MTLDEYRAHVRTLSASLAHARAALSLVPLEEIEAQLEKADSLGPVLDPTAWREADRSGLLDAQRALVKWARKTRETGDRLQTFGLSVVERLARAAEQHPSATEVMRAERQEVRAEDVGELHLEEPPA